MSTVPNGQSSYVGTTGGSVTFADRYGYVAVTNTGTVPIYVTADGSTPETSGAGNAIVVMPNATEVIANGLPLWFPSSRVIPQGSNLFGGGNTASSPSSPGAVTPMESIAGQMANPGTNITVAGTVTGFVLEGTG
jgi:hypothetical protein